MANVRVVSVTLDDPGDSGSRRLRAIVRNDTAEQLHVSGEMSGLSYDPAGQVLTVEFGVPHDDDPGPGIEMISAHPFVPLQVVLGAGEEAELTAIVPARIYEYNRGGGLSSIAKAGAEIGTVARVDVRVASSPTPFQPPLDLDPKARIRHMREQARFDVESAVPSRPDKDQRSE